MRGADWTSRFFTTTFTALAGRTSLWCTGCSPVGRNGSRTSRRCLRSAARSSSNYSATDGPSPEEPPAYTPSGYVAEFERLRQFLGADRWLVCGQSLGAALTLRYALDRPERVLAHVFTNSMSALAEPGWRNAVVPLMQAAADRLARSGRSAIDDHPLNPGRASRLPAHVRKALVEDSRLHDPRGIALTGLHTVPDSPVRERITRNTVPSLLVVGEREKRFREYRRFAEQQMPRLSVVGYDAGHAVNAEVADAFNREAEAFFGPFVDGATAFGSGEGRTDV